MEKYTILQKFIILVILKNYQMTQKIGKDRNQSDMNHSMTDLQTFRHKTFNLKQKLKWKPVSKCFQ